MNVRDKLFGISTKNLYIGQLTSQIIKYDVMTNVTDYSVLKPKGNYVLVKQKNKLLESKSLRRKKYKDTFSHSTYNPFNQIGNLPNETVVIPVRKIIVKQKRIKYKDAQMLIDRLNFGDEIDEKIKVKR